MTQGKMTQEEAIQLLNRLYMMADIIDEYGDMEDTQSYEEAVNMAVNALHREQQFLDAGYKNGRVEFMIGGRRFMVKEMAQ